MLDEGSQERLVIAYGQGGDVNVVDEIRKLAGREVRQRIGFAVAPNQLDWVQFGRVGRQQIGVDGAAVPNQPCGDGFADVRLQSVPDHDDWAAQVSPQLAEEGENCGAVKIGIGQQTEVCAHAAATGRDRQSANHADLAARAAALHEHRCLATPRPSAAHQGCHQEAGFVDEDDGGAAAGGVFFTRGHWSLTQRRIASSSRSRARRSGFCGLQPKL